MVANHVYRLALNGTFTVFYFIGAFENDAPENYMFQPTLAGLSANFASSVELCDNCGQSALQRQLVSDTTVITPMLLDYIKIGILLDLSPSNVVPFLISNLKWRVVTVSILSIPTKNSLTLTVKGRWPTCRPTSSCWFQDRRVVEGSAITRCCRTACIRGIPADHRANH